MRPNELSCCPNDYYYLNFILTIYEPECPNEKMSFVLYLIFISKFPSDSSPATSTFLAIQQLSRNTEEEEALAQS